MLKTSLPWVSPLELASKIASSEQKCVLLYSGVRTSYSGRYSYLAWGLREEVKSEDFSEFEDVLAHDKYTWFGYLGYGLKDSLEQLQKSPKNWLNLPNLWMMRFESIYQFDHEKQTVTLWSDGNKEEWIAAPLTPPRNDDTSLPQVTKITSNMSDAQYLQKVAKIIENIHAGELYQANLTRKFYGEFAEIPNDFALFKKLCEVSPAPFSAFIRLGDTSIISSSPESFLRIDASGNVVTRPIKGTAPRGKDKIADKNLRDALKNSEKDRAENLMIVDLMRNDLAKTCELGSIKTEALFEVTTHATIHHLSSTITGKKSSKYSVLDVVKSAFPAGSMTGAPKIRAMNLCSELEGDARGVYSGAIGWFAEDGACDLSVVIRTIILRGKQFEFQVGGGIVADSTPEAELQETIAKARGIMLSLGITDLPK